MTWKAKRFAELTTTELYKIYYLRTATFVVGQDRVYQEVDDRDPQAIHVFDQDSAGDVVAYARVYPIDDGAKVSFGRVVTSSKVRGQGIGRQLLEEVMKTIRDNFPGKPIEIESQKQVEGFYQKFGFTSKGGTFIFESTPHVVMVHEGLK
ncbi:MAG: GNAT family N-acetyltransferase [Lactobacillaceae bacterium]|nr:GNAT family N-acetyltransferase [Lactobacillaceae bacterium]